MNAILKILNLQLEKKLHGLTIATFETIDRLDYAGLSIAREALDPKPLLDALDELGDALSCSQTIKSFCMTSHGCAKSFWHTSTNVQAFCSTWIIRWPRC